MTVCAEKFTALLKEKNIKFDVEERETCTAVFITLTGKHNNSLNIGLFFENDETHFSIRMFSLVSVQEEQFASTLLACNQLNADYMWVKFYVNDKNNVMLADDAIISADTCRDEVWELLIRIVRIADDCYPTFMRAMWGS